MKRSMMNPALVAGLGGASLVFAPNIAFGLTAQGIADAFFTSPIAPFTVGVLGGAAVAGTVYNLVVKYAELKESGSDLSFSFIAPRRHAKKTSRPSHAMHAAEAPVAASLYKARHMSPADFEKSGVIRIQPAQDYAELRNAANDSRKKRTQKHLKTSFMETIDNVMMNGVPVIERADGTVGDVGTGWWSRGIGDKSTSSDNALAGEAPVDAFLHNRNRLTPQNITHRVAQIDEGLYPEKRTADDLDKSDMWPSALEALDDKLYGLGRDFHAAHASVFRPGADLAGSPVLPRLRQVHRRRAMRRNPHEKKRHQREQQERQPRHGTVRFPPFHGR